MFLPQDMFSRDNRIKQNFGEKNLEIRVEFRPHNLHRRGRLGKIKVMGKTVSWGDQVEGKEAIG